MSVLLAIGVLLASPEQPRTAPIELDIPKDWRIEIVNGKQQAPGALLVAVPAGGFKGLRVSSTPLVENERGVGADGELCVTLGSPRKKDDACTIQAGPADVPAGKAVDALETQAQQYKNKLAATRSPASAAAPKKTLWPSFLRTPGARLGTAEVLVAVVSAVVATCTGLLALYAMPFGRFDQYVGAFLWGFGIDSSVRGFRAVFQKLDGA